MRPLETRGMSYRDAARKLLPRHARLRYIVLRMIFSPRWLLRCAKDRTVYTNLEKKPSAFCSDQCGEAAKPDCRVAARSWRCLITALQISGSTWSAPGVAMGRAFDRLKRDVMQKAPQGGSG